MKYKKLITVNHMKTNIIKSNMLIAEFMGASVKRFGALNKLSVFWPDNHPNRPTYNGAGLETYVYHSSWDWLMPVVEKIEKTKEADIIIHAKNLVVIGYNKQTKQYFNSALINNIWLAVVEFIKWYNTTTHPIR